MTVARRAVHPAFRDRIPLVIAIVEFDEGPRMLTNLLVVEPAQVQIGDRVEVAFEEVDDDVVFPMFIPIQKESDE